MSRLLPLVTQLKNCSTHATTVSRELFLECWGELQREDVTAYIKPTVPVMAALILNNEDDAFGQLLQSEERAQLRALVQRTLDRYEQQTHPPNKLGRLLFGHCVAATIRKESI